MRALSVLSLLGLVACTASLDLDRFRKEEARTAINVASITYFDFRFAGRNMQSHVGEVMEWRLVDRANTVQAKAVFANVPKPDFTIEFPKLIPKTGGPYRVDFWADHNFSNRYDGIVGGINDKDHAWRRVIEEPFPEDVQLVDGRYELSFLHDTNFVDMHTDVEGNPITGEDVLLPFKLNISGVEAYANKTIEVRVADKGSGRLVGLHRRGIVRTPYAAEVTGVLDEETPYEITVFVDLDDADEYRAAYPSWKLEVLSTQRGISADLDLATTAQTPLGDIR